jgi:hypothetical protein
VSCRPSAQQGYLVCIPLSYIYITAHQYPGDYTSHSKQVDRQVLRISSGKIPEKIVQDDVGRVNAALGEPQPYPGAYR